jgi:hypothetical protein
MNDVCGKYRGESGASGDAEGKNLGISACSTFKNMMRDED